MVAVLGGGPDLGIYSRASDVFVSRELVDGEADVGCGVLAGRGGERFGVHVGDELRVSCVLRVRPRLLGDGGYCWRLRASVDKRMLLGLELLAGDADAA